MFRSPLAETKRFQNTAKQLHDTLDSCAFDWWMGLKQKGNMVKFNLNFVPEFEGLLL